MQNNHLWRRIELHRGGCYRNKKQPPQSRSSTVADDTNMLLKAILP